MTEHHITYAHGGDLDELKRTIVRLGWAGRVGRKHGKAVSLHRLKDFFNDQSQETILMLINIHEGVYGFINKPTPDMERLQELKWKL